MRRWRAFGMGWCVLLGCSRTPDELPAERDVEGQHAALEATLVVSFPQSITLGDFAFVGAADVRIHPRAEVTGLVVNVGTGVSELHADAQSGPLLSAAPVTLMDRARVHGDVTTSSTTIRRAGAVITGTLLENEPIPTFTRNLRADFGSGSDGPVRTERDQGRVLAPGSYTTITVNAGSWLQLSEGRYHATALVLESDSELRLAAGGPVSVFVRDSLTLRGRIVPVVAESAPGFFIGYFGAADVPLEGPFSGALAAPNARVSMQTGGPFVGQLVARSVELGAGLRWEKRAFSYWERLLDSAAPDRDPASLGGETLADLLPPDEIGAALRELIHATFANTDEQVRQAALARLRSLPPREVIAALSSGFQATTDPSVRFALVGVADELNHAESLPWLVSVLATPVPDDLVRDAHGRWESHLRFFSRAAGAIGGLVESGVPEARPALLELATAHPLQFVRSSAIRAVVLWGDPELRARLEATIRAEDRTFLTAVPLTREEVERMVQQLPDPPPTPEEDDALPLPGEGDADAGPLHPDDPDTDRGAPGGADEACTESTATELGAPGNNVTVVNRGCVRVRDGYPSWWRTRAMRLETASGGTYPVGFSWSNACSESGGSGVFTADWQGHRLATTSAACPTVIELQGSGDGHVTLRYWAASSHPE